MGRTTTVIGTGTMRTLIAVGTLLFTLTAAVAEEPPAVSTAAVGTPMQIVPAVIGQPMHPRSQASAPVTDAPKLLIAAPEVFVTTQPPVQVAATHP